MRRPWLGFVVVAIVTLALDQGSKAWARTLPTSPPGCSVADLAQHHCRGVPQPVIEGYWDWQLAMNDGVAFSALRGKTTLLLVIALGALAAIAYSAWRARPEERWRRAGLALVFGGAAGNFLDRLRDGAVTDFVVWRIHEHRWPVFNVADVVLVIGFALLAVEIFVARRRPGTLAA